MPFSICAIYCTLLINAFISLGDKKHRVDSQQIILMEVQGNLKLLKGQRLCDIL